MMNILDFVIVALSIVLGAMLMRWHEQDKDCAVRREREKTHKWRSESEKMRVNWVCADIAYKAMQQGVQIDLDDGQGDEPPLPLVFGDQEQAELEVQGAFVRRRMAGRG